MTRLIKTRLPTEGFPPAGGLCFIRKVNRIRAFLEKQAHFKQRLNGRRGRAHFAFIG